ncbi:hypothetical protein Q7689_31985 [Nocardiopsis tropica]|nr:hypothetical protein [Nocardiopsis tropica]
MSTSPEDTNPTDETPGAAAEETRAAGDTGAGNAFLEGTPVGPPPTPGGLFAAETFSVIGLLLFALTTVHTRLFELFSWFFLSGAAPSHSAQQARPCSRPRSPARAA